MSHLVCPLCGKNAPLSTLNPEKYPLDLRVVSFKGLGRGKGFEKSEEYSILGDDEYSPVIGKRCVQLVGVFIEAGVLDRDEVGNNLKITSEKGADEESSLIIKDLESRLSQQEKELQNKSALFSEYSNRYDNVTRQLNEAKQIIDQNDNELYLIRKENSEKAEEYEMEAQVNYILMMSPYSEPSTIEVDVGTEGKKLFVRLSKDEPGLYPYFFLIISQIPVSLKERLLKRIKYDEDVKFLYQTLSLTPPATPVQNMLLASVSQEITEQYLDDNGNLQYRQVYGLPVMPANDFRIPLERLMKIISDAKEKLQRELARR